MIFVRIAVCDDDKAFISEIIKNIEEIKTCNDVISVNEYLSGEKLLNDFHSNLFDIIILDIEMEGINGIKTAEYIRKIDANVIIIFLTSFESFVYRGYEVKAFRYILKNQPMSLRLEQLRAAINEGFLNNLTIILPYRYSDCKFRLRDIMFIEVLGREITVHTKDEKFSFTGRLADYEKELVSNRFIKTNKSFLVNTLNISFIDKTDVIMTNGEKVPLSRKYRNQVEEAFISIESER